MKIFTAFILLLFITSTTYAATIRVPEDHNTIQAAIDAAKNGDTVLINDGIYTGDGNIGLSFGGKAITVKSVNGPDKTFIDCEKKARGFTFNSGETSTSVLDGVTISHGVSDEFGGGGIFCAAGPRILNCVLLNNTTSGTSGGGGIIVASSADEPPTLINCVIAQNTADFGGGVACLSGGSPEIINCTITENMAIGGDGGGFFSHAGKPEIRNTIIWGNNGRDPEVHIAVNSEPTITFSNVRGGQAGLKGDENALAKTTYQNNIDADPDFIDAENRNYRLHIGSPCIDAGTANGAPAIDNDGNPRPKGNGVDIGAYERVSSVEVTFPQIVPGTAGQSVVVEIRVAVLEDLRSFSFDLAFDPTILRANVGRNPPTSPFLSNSGADAIICDTPNVNNTTSLIAGISCRRADANGVVGSGVLTQIAFDTLKTGTSALAIQNARFIAPDNAELDFTAASGSVTVFGTHGRITGHVTDSEGKPMRGITVTALQGDTPVGISGTTNANGDYAIDNLTAAGNVTVRASGGGLVPTVTTNVRVQLGQTTANTDLVLLKPTALHSVVDANGFIRNWLLLGPIPWENDVNRLLTDQLSATNPAELIQPQEQQRRTLLPSEGDAGTGLARRRRWTLHIPADSGARIQFGALYGEIKAVAYAFTSVKSPRQQSVRLGFHAQFDNGVAIWLNGELVELKSGNLANDGELTEVLTLKKGWNSLLVKVSNPRGWWSFIARFETPGTPLIPSKPITDLEISPQPQRTDVTQRKTQLSLTRGINMISLPLKPDTPFTAATLAAALNTTIVIRVDNGGFDAYVHAVQRGTDFPIEMGKGYIVNLIDAIPNFEITGQAWGEPAAPPLAGNNAAPTWAFVVAGQVDGLIPAEGRIRALNRRTGASVVAPIDVSGVFTVSLVDMSRRPVVSVGDEIEVQLLGAGTSTLHVLREQELKHAYLLTHLSATPEQTQLLQNYPNPFNPETWIPFQLAQDAHVSIALYSFDGQLIRRLELGHRSAGWHLSKERAAYWDGRNQAGERVSSGVYFYHLKAGDFTAMRRMVVVK